MTNHKNARKRPLLFWFLPVGLMLVSAILIVFARGVGIATAGDVTRCLLLNDNDNISTLYDAVTGNQLRLNVTRILPQQLGISPDSNHTLFRQYIKQSGLWRQQLFVKSTNGQTVMLPSNIIGVSTAPVWSNSGKRLALGIQLATGSPLNAALLIADKEGLNSQIVPLNGNDVGWLMWSSDDLFIATRNLRQNVIMLRVDNLWERHDLPHSTDPNGINELIWSRNGHRLAYIWGNPAHFAVYDFDTGVEQHILSPSMNGHVPFLGWSPDSRYIFTRAAGLRSQIILYDLLTPEPLTGFLIDETTDTALSWWSPDGCALIYIQADTNALIAYYPQNRRYKTLITEDVFAVQPSVNDQKLLILRKTANTFNLDVLLSPEQSLIHVIDHLTEIPGTFWLPNSNGLVVSFKRGDKYELAATNSSGSDVQPILKNLIQAPFVRNAAYLKYDSKQLQIWWQVNGAANFAVYDWMEHHLIFYDVNVDFDLMFGNGNTFISPDERYALLELDEPNRAGIGARHSIAMAWTDNRPMKFLEHNLEPPDWTAEWTPDSQYVALNFRQNEFAEVVNEQGQIIHRWDAPQKRIDQLGWIDCKP